MADSSKDQCWNGRKRIQAAFEFTRPDRVPLFDQTIGSEVASKVIGREMQVGGASLRFREVEARFAGEKAAREFEEKMLEDVALFYRQMSYDMARLPWRDTRKATRKIDRYTYLFGDPESEGPWEVYHFSPESRDWHVKDGWLAGGNVDALLFHLEKEIRLWQGPDVDPTRMDVLRKFKSLVGNDLTLAVSVAMLMIPMWEPAWLMALEMAPDLVASEIDRQVEQGLADLELAAEIGADVVHSGGDFCLNSGPVYSPETFDRLILPGLKKLVAKCNELGLKYVFRTDGITWPVADSLFGESGVHGYGEIDYSAGMRLKDLRRRFPKLTLLGNLDCGGALIFGTVDEVRAAVRENIEQTGGIGHILGSSNTIMPETPPENYLAMLDEAARFKL